MNTQNSLYELLCKEETLYESWKAIRIKNSAGGIDGITLAYFEENAQKYITEIADELKKGIWVPEPYLGIEIPKKKNEVRKLGLLSVKDKIVQHTIKTLVEPFFENTFVDNSYAYRPNKGHTKAIRRTLNECKKKKNNWVVRLDIDNYFDSINHHLLGAKLHTLIPDEEIVRLIMLSVQMGVVNRQLKWTDTTEGVPQGAILSPLLANFYLAPFDKYALTLSRSYIRYADDFCIMCETHATAKSILSQISNYLLSHLGLKLNPPIITELRTGFEFLGITISKNGLSISSQKETDLKERISNIEIANKKILPEALRSWNGVKNYYGFLLPQNILQNLDDILYNHIKKLIILHYQEIANRAVLKRILSEISYLSNEYQLYQKRIIQDCIETYDLQKGIAKEQRAKEQNQKIINQRKAEYRKREGEGIELLVNTFGCFIGLSGKGITVKQQGRVIAQRPIGSLSHITIASKGITISSNLIDYCLANKISIDFFNSSGTHSGSILSTKYIENTLWNKQALCGIDKRMKLAISIINSKLKNQYYLIKYFHKYHKRCYDELNNKYKDMVDFNLHLKEHLKQLDHNHTNFLPLLVGYESQGAIKYWAYIRELLKDDEVSFVKLNIEEQPT